MSNGTSLHNLNPSHGPGHISIVTPQHGVSHQTNPKYQLQQKLQPQSHSTQPVSDLIKLPGSNQQMGFTSQDSDGSLVDDGEEDQMNTLDIPEIPSMLTSDVTRLALPNTLISAPISLIGMPLPANFVVADALYPIPSPAPEHAGRCQSKYWRERTQETVRNNIRQSKYWRDHQEDTIFFSRPSDDDVVSIGDHRRKLGERHMDLELSDIGTGPSRSQSRSVSIRKDSVDVYTSLEKLERGIAEIKAKQAELMRKRARERGEPYHSPQLSCEPSPGNKHTPVRQEHASPPSVTKTREATKMEQDTEDVLASLGVTGAPKPVTMINEQLRERTYALPNRINVEDSRFDGSTTSPKFRPPVPPPPPPPSAYERGILSNVTNRSLSSAGPGQSNGHVLDANAVDQDHEHLDRTENQLWTSPKEALFEMSGSRKRSYSHRRDASSSDEDTPARRQEDDVTPKFKRRQPKVAPAYR